MSDFIRDVIKCEGCEKTETSISLCLEHSYDFAMIKAVDPNRQYNLKTMSCGYEVSQRLSEKENG